MQIHEIIILHLIIYFPYFNKKYLQIYIKHGPQTLPFNGRQQHRGIHSGLRKGAVLDAQT